jgi:hypothetical protein
MHNPASDLCKCQPIERSSADLGISEGEQMSNPNLERYEADLAEQQKQIEAIEVQLNLKDATVASECEVNNLRAAQQIHRDNIHDLKKKHTT